MHASSTSPATRMRVSPVTACTSVCCCDKLKTTQPCVGVFVSNLERLSTHATVFHKLRKSLSDLPSGCDLRTENMVFVCQLLQIDLCLLLPVCAHAQLRSVWQMSLP
eukprot:2098490-Pleurochrysis_carterae.AAC.6